MSEAGLDPRSATAEELLDHAGWIRSLARRLVGDDQAEDLVQDAYVAALARPDAARGPRGAWLAGVVRNLARFRARGDAHRRTRERDAGQSESLPSPAELTQRAEHQRLIVDAVLALDEPFRETLLLRYFEGLSSATIAARRGEPAATVRSRLARGVERVREALDRRHDGRREEWLTALAPLTSVSMESASRATAQVLTGASMMKTANVAVGSVVVCLAAFVAWRMSDAGEGATVAAEDPSHGTMDGPAPPRAGSDAPHPDEAGGSATDPSPVEVAATGEREPVTPPAAPPVTTARPDSAPFVGRVLDERTGQPAAFLRLDVLHGESREELVTDAAGRFASLRDYPAGDLVVDLVGERDPRDVLQGSGRDAFRSWEWTRTIAHAADGASAEERDIELPVGPRYPLRISAPVPIKPTDLQARLRAADPRFAWDHIHGRVRHEGGAPWVRFSPLACLISGGPPYRLIVGTEDGLLYGDAQVDPVVGDRREPVEIELQARGAVRGVALRPDGTPLGRTWVQLWPEGASLDSGDPDARPQFLIADESGAFHGPWLAPGAYVVTAEATGCEDYREEIEIVAGVELVHDVELRALAADGRITGVVTSRTGAYHGALAVVVQRKGGGERSVVDVAWTEAEDGTWSGSFEATGIGDAPQIVSFDGQGFLHVEPPYPEARPDAHLSFVVHDDHELRDVVVHARAEDGAAVESFRAWLTVDPHGSSRQVHARASEGVAVFRSVPTDLPWRVRVDTEGFAMAWADSLAFDPAGGALTVDVRRGWASRLTTRGPDREPLAGVLVTVDGAIAGRTDAHGELVVQRDAEPESVRFELEGWEPVADSVYNPETGAFRSFLWYQNVTLRPVDD